MKPKIMLVGLGDLGGVTLELLAREPDLNRIVVCSRNENRGRARCNLARLSALAQGSDADIRFVPLDLNNPEATAETVHGEFPDLILNTATMQSWCLPNRLPAPQAARLKRAGFGVWLPVHLTLTMKLMQALRDSHYAGVTLSAPFPDVVNCILARIGLAPTCGIGNLAEVIPKVRWLAARSLSTRLDTIRLFLVAHHALQAVTFRTAEIDSDTDIPPYFLRVECDGEDVTQRVGAGELLFAPYPLTPGYAIHSLTAATAVQLIKVLFSEGKMSVHAPAPNGLPGGYPVIAGNGKVEPEPVPGLSLDEAIKINERSHRFDGIERIEPDGTAVFVPESAALFKEMFGYDCQRLPPGESQERAQELIRRFREVAQKQGVNLSTEG